MDFKNYLLTIAIDKYQEAAFPNLNNAKLDAEKFIKITTLKYGFKEFQNPLFDENATRKNILEALHNLSISLTAEHNLIIYFAGHGTIHPKTKKGYWIPSDAGNTISDFIPNSTIVDVIEGIDAKHILLISDSCFSGTFLTRTRNINLEIYYDKLLEKKSRWLFASGREEVVSDGAPGIGSPFAIALTTFLEKNQNRHLSLSEIFMAVEKDTGSIAEQQPIFAHIQGTGHEGGQLVFDSGNVEINIEDPILIEDSELLRIVTPFEVSCELKNIGVPQKSTFAFYYSNGRHVVKKFEELSDFICSAFIFDEIIDLIPDMIDLDARAHVATQKGWRKLDEEEIATSYAEVSNQKTWAEPHPYMSACRYEGNVIAFSKAEGGRFNNLICWGDNQAEATGKMLIELIKEKKIIL